MPSENVVMYELAQKASGSKYVPFLAGIRNVLNNVLGSVIISAQKTTASTAGFLSKFSTAITPALNEIANLSRSVRAIAALGAVVDPHDKSGIHEVYRQSSKVEAAMTGAVSLMPQITQMAEDIKKMDMNEQLVKYGVQNIADWESTVEDDSGTGKKKKRKKKKSTGKFYNIPTLGTRRY